MKITTSITHIKDGKEIIRGKKLDDLVKKYSFSETIFFLFRSRMPKPNEARMFDAILTSAIDHGAGTASALTARISASAVNDMHTSLAAGILGFGARHGMAVEQAMKTFQTFLSDTEMTPTQMVQGFKDIKLRIPGYGHRVLTKDHRSILLFKIAKEQDLFRRACTWAIAVEKELNKQSKKPIPLNIDGAIAAILCDMGFTPQQGVSVFLAARVPGLLAHICEEQTGDEGLRRLSEENITYLS